MTSKSYVGDVDQRAAAVENGRLVALEPRLARRGAGFRTRRSGTHPYHSEVADQRSPDSTLDSLVDAIGRRDIEGSLAAISAGEACAIVGSEAGESAWGREAINAFFTRIFMRPGSFRFEFPERVWTFRGEIAWLVAEGRVVEPAATVPKPYRLTAVFVREATVWRLALWSGAEPPNSAL
jgi:hypothetical protein